MAAALLVRLNRTMPTLDWKSIEPDRRKDLTEEIVFLTREYVIILVLVGSIVTSLLALAAVGDEIVFGKRSIWTVAQLSDGWPESVRRALSAFLGFGFALVMVRMGYVVWRDYDIARLQKTIVDGAAETERHQEQIRASDEKISNIAKAGLRSVSASAPKEWEE